MHKRPKIVAWQQSSSHHITSAMASIGFDWLVIDLEHSAISLNEIEPIFLAASNNGAKPFARLPSHDPFLARRLLDSGAEGLFIPVIETLEEFESFAKHCFFPPKGRRGVGLVKANNWGDKFEEYYSNFDPILIAQIETKLGAENISSIVQSECLSGVMIGPYDLSASLGTPGNFEDANFKSACTKIISTTKEFNKDIGFHQVKPVKEELIKRQEEGYDFIIYGTDIIALKHAFEGQI